MKNIKSILTVASSLLFIAACGGSNNNNDIDAPENVTIRGVINETLPSLPLKLRCLAINSITVC